MTYCNELDEMADVLRFLGVPMYANPSKVNVRCGLERDVDSSLTCFKDHTSPLSAVLCVLLRVTPQSVAIDGRLPYVGVTTGYDPSNPAVGLAHNVTAYLSRGIQPHEKVMPRRAMEIFYEVATRNGVSFLPTLPPAIGGYWNDKVHEALQFGVWVN